MSERLRIEREQVLGPADAAQGEAADRHQRGARSLSGSAVGEGRGDQHGRSTERHIEAMRLVSLTAGPTTVKSSRSTLPILP